MNRSLRILALVAISGAPLLAQQSLRSHLAPITAPIRRAGVYHVATGTWTRNASLANVTGPDTIYNNTCAPIYYSRMQLGDVFQHRSRIPSTSGPTTGSIYYAPGCILGPFDEVPGCHDSYTINGFQVAYCSSAAATVDWLHEFASSFTLCGPGDMTPQYSWAITGLPGGTSSGGQQCWIVDIDLSSSTPAMVLSADGDGSYTQTSADETFGWSFGPTSSLSLSDSTGPIVAGDFTWTGGPGTVAGVLTPCTGTDGTIWDNPINLAESGTGMSSLDFFRVTGPNPSPPSGPGCYDFGSTPHADFWLKMYCDPQCPVSNPLASLFCFPGEGGTKACTTCNPPNPPGAHARGCNNYGQSTGGAFLNSTGNSEVNHDTLVFISQFENSTAFTVLIQGTMTVNLVFGAGIRCVGGNLKRIYTGSAGTASECNFLPGLFHRPSEADPRSVHQASLDRGYDIGAHAPVTLYYQAYYRDPNASSHCGGATFNSSEAVSVNWVP